METRYLVVKVGVHCKLPENHEPTTGEQLSIDVVSGAEPSHFTRWGKG